MFPVDLTSSPPPNPARRHSALRKRIATCEFHLRSSMRLQRNLGGPWTSQRFRNPRRPKSWPPSLPTRTRSPRVTSRSPNAASAAVLSVGTISLRPTRRNDAPWLSLASDDGGRAPVKFGRQKVGRIQFPNQGIQAAFRNGPYSTLAFGSADANSFARVWLSSAR